MTAVINSFLLFAPEGFGLSSMISLSAGLIVTLASGT